MSTRVNKVLFTGSVGYQEKKIWKFSQKGERIKSSDFDKRRKFKIKCFYYKNLGPMIKGCKKKIMNEKQNKESKNSQSNIATKRQVLCYLQFLS